MAKLISPDPRLQFFTANGDPLSGGKLYTYAAGTTTPQTTWTDSTGATPNANPVILDSRGECSVWLGTLLYKFALYSSTNTLIWTVDNLGAAITAASVTPLGVDTVAAFQAASIGAGITTVVTNGYTSAGDAGGAMYIRTGTTGPGPGLVQSADGQWWILAGGQDLNIQMFGGIDDGTTANDTAVTAALTFFRVNEEPSTQLWGGPHIRFPRVTTGIYLFTQTIDLKRSSVILEGDAVGTYGGQTTVFRFAASITGIRGQFYNTTGVTTAAATTGADGSIIRNISLESLGGSYAANQGHGVHMRCRMALEHVSIRYFPGNGINIQASSGGVGVAAGNANSWRLTDVSSLGNGGHGLFADGTDANAGLANGLQCQINGGVGIYDSSFLGNVYICPQTATNTLMGYKTDDPNARNVFIYPYAEDDQPTSTIVSPTIILGPINIDKFSGTGVQLYNQLGVFTAKGGVAGRDTSGGNTVIAELGTLASNGDVLVATNLPTIAPNGFRLPAFSGADLVYNYGNGVSFLEITGPTTSQKFTGSVNAPLVNWAGRKAGFAFGNIPVVWNMRDSIPVSTNGTGTDGVIYQRYSKVWNTNGTGIAASVEYWILTTLAGGGDTWTAKNF